MQGSGSGRAPAKSFIVRVWPEESGLELRGEVEFIGTGERRFFPNSYSLLALLDEWRRDMDLAV